MRVPLTPEQIDSILNDLPTPPGAGKTAVRIARDQIGKMIRDYLEDPASQILLPQNSPEAFQEFKDKLIESLYLSFIEAGSPVGILAATALGGPLVQLTMNTFHFAGQQSGVASAFNQVRDFLTGTRTNKNPSMKIFLKDPTTGSDLHDVLHVGTTESIYAMRPELEETTAKDLVANYEIIDRAEAIQEGIPELINLHARLRPERFQNAELKYPLTYVLLLELNVYRMYTYRITMQELATGIEGQSPPDSLTCVWKSQLEGKMYVLVDEQRDYGLKTVTHQNAILMFIDQKVIPSMDNWTIKGIRGIAAIEPREVNVIEGIDRILDANRKTFYHLPTTSRQIVKLSQKKTRTEGVSTYDVYRLLYVTGFRVLEVNKDQLEIVVEHEGDIMEDLRTRIANGRKAQNQSIINAATFAYIVTRGSNYNEIIWRDDVDLYRSHPMSPHEVAALLGINAARSYLISAFTDTLQQFSSYINKRHIEMTYDLLVNLGLINSLTFAGVNRRALGPMTAASHQRSMEVFANSSIFGDNEKILGISPAMYVGQQSSQIGTGSIGIVPEDTITVSDRPGLQPSDQIIQEELLAGILEENELEELFPQTAPGGVDKAEILRTSTVSDQAPVKTGLLENIMPAGGTQDKVSPALLSALAKVTIGTNIEFTDTSGGPLQEISEPGIIPEITEPEVEEGIPVRGRPLVSQPYDVLGSLRIPLQPLEPSLPSAANPQEPIGIVPETTKEGGLLPPPASIPGVVNVLPPIESVQAPGPKAVILNTPPPRPQPPPSLPIPRPPRSIARAPPVNTIAEFDFSSFIAQLPPPTPVQPVVQREVKPINYNAFLEALK